MLIIQRIEDESIIINGNIEVKVLRPRGFIDDPDFPVRKVRLGITAPRDISVHRKEVQDAIDKEKNLSGSTCSS